MLFADEKKLNQFHSVLSNTDINLCARRVLLLSVVQPSIEYGSAVWDCNKNQPSTLEAIILGGAKKIHLKLATRQLEGIWV